MANSNKNDRQQYRQVLVAFAQAADEYYALEKLGVKNPALQQRLNTLSDMANKLAAEPMYQGLAGWLAKNWDTNCAAHDYVKAKQLAAADAKGLARPPPVHQSKVE